MRATSQSRKPARPMVSSSRNTARPKIFAAMVCLKARAFAQIRFWVVSIAAREFRAASFLVSINLGPPYPKAEKISSYARKPAPN